MIWQSRIGRTKLVANCRVRISSTFAAFLRSDTHIRERRVAFAALASFGSQFTSIAVTLVTVRIALQHLGSSDYGTVATVTALATLFGIADFGLGNGLLNLVARGKAKGDYEGIQRSVSTAFNLLIIIALSIAVIAWVTQRATSWTSLVLGAAADRPGVGLGIAFAVGAICFGMPLGVAGRVNLGFQESYRTSSWNIAGSLSTLVGVIAAIRFDGGIAAITLAIVLGPTIGAALSFADRFGRISKGIAPHIGVISGGEAKQLSRTGGYFFIIQLAGIIAYQTDVLIVNRISGSGSVAEYSVAARLFMFIPVLLSLVLIPLWPAYTEALETRDVNWIRLTLRRTLGIGVVFNSMTSFLLLFATPSLVRLWTDGEVVVDLWLKSGFVLFVILNGAIGPLATLLNGLQMFRVQAQTAVAMAIMNVGLSAALTQRLGPGGAIWGTVVSQLIVIVPVSLIVTSRQLNRLNSTS